MHLAAALWWEIFGVDESLKFPRGRWVIDIHFQIFLAFFSIEICPKVQSMIKIKFGECYRVQLSPSYSIYIYEKL